MNNSISADKKSLDRAMTALQATLVALRERIDDPESVSRLQTAFDLSHQSQPNIKTQTRWETPDQACQVCFESYSGNAIPVQMDSCGHQTTCMDCFKQYVSTKVEDRDLQPWVVCPGPTCRKAVHPSILHAYTDMRTIMQLTAAVLGRYVARSRYFYACAGDDCEFGFVVADKNRLGGNRTCPVCSHKQDLSKAAEDALQHFKDLASSNGDVRLCPVCDYPAMKDYGMCNIMQCGRCAIWWNWRTRDSGSSYAELKQKGRWNGSLWEPGELHYQLRLQRSDPDAFKNLLERNGIKYDPNFVRGAS